MRAWYLLTSLVSCNSKRDFLWRFSLSDGVVKIMCGNNQATKEIIAIFDDLCGILEKRSEQRDSSVIVHCGLSTRLHISHAELCSYESHC